MPRIGYARGSAILLLVVATIVVAFEMRDAPSSSARRTQGLRFAFWNVENLFDAQDDPHNGGDDEYLPEQGWTEQHYTTKRAQLAKVIAALEPHLLGLCEVENRAVLEALVAEPGLLELGYRIAHEESPDHRGIDNALLYREPFRLAGDEKRAIVVHPLKGNPASRGIFEVRLQVGGQPLRVFVNHWPSRRGGAKAEKQRLGAGSQLHELVYSSAGADGRTDDVLILGDFNDDPFDDSVREGLHAVRSRNAVLNRRTGQLLYNPTWRFFGETDLGTTYYNRHWRWHLFDQVIVSRGLLDEQGFRLDENSLAIYAPAELRDDKNRPRWFRGKNALTGYSDHFPIHGVLVVK